MGFSVESLSVDLETASVPTLSAEEMDRMGQALAKYGYTQLRKPVNTLKDVNEIVAYLGLAPNQVLVDAYERGCPEIWVSAYA